MGTLFVPTRLSMFHDDCHTNPAMADSFTCGASKHDGDAMGVCVSDCEGTKNMTPLSLLKRVNFKGQAGGGVPPPADDKEEKSKHSGRNKHEDGATHDHCALKIGVLYNA
jgi:hypothetical protein